MGSHSLSCFCVFYIAVRGYNGHLHYYLYLIMQAKRLLKEERVETELLEGDEDKQEKKVSTFNMSNVSHAEFQIRGVWRIIHFSQ